MGLELAGNGGSYGYMDDVNLTDSQVFYQVKNALTSALQGDSVQYNGFIGVMHHTKDLSTEEVATLVTCLKTLSEAVSCIDIVHHRSLVDAIFAMCLWKYDSLVMNALVDLITSLAASSATYIDMCLDFLVCNFMPPGFLLEESRYLKNKDQVLDVVHSTLKRIADLVPLSPWRLDKIVRCRMPTKFDKGPTLLLVVYVENMLRLESSTMGELIGSSMLSAVVDRLIELDVEISWDEILQDDFNKGIFEMELEDLEGPEDNHEENGDELCRENWIDKFFGGNATAEQLDSLMVVTFEHLKFVMESGRLHLVFEILLQSFQRTVLTAHKAKFAQFVMFYACSLDPDICGKQFAVSLFDIFLSSSIQQWRMSAVAYLASYLSRAKFFSDRWVVGILERLINWCADYCQNKDGDSNPRAHRVFYAGCQAFMYVLCFRIRSIIAIPGVESQLALMRIHDVLKHPLDPLKVCLPSIVEEFLRVTKSLRLFVPGNVIQSGLLESEYSVGFGGIERLDMFFPFDPCLLKKSDRFIRPYYYYWSMVRSNGERDDDDDEDEDEDKDCSDEDAIIVGAGGTRMTLDDDDDEAQRSDDGLDYSLNKMSITPKTTLGYHFGGETRMPSRIRPSTSPESL